MSLFTKIAYQVGQKYASNLDGKSGVAQFGLGFLQTQAAAAVKAGNRKTIGGISLEEARRIFEQASSIDRAKKNLFHLNISNLKTGIAPSVNLFATEVSYGDFQVQGEPVHIGSGTMDTVTGIAPTEMRITTMDDVGGSIKVWFNTLKRSMAHPDGTFGLPMEYLVRITVTHGFISMDADGAYGAYSDSFIMRPAGIEKELSRREDGLQELQLLFQQFDTFTNLV